MTAHYLLKKEGKTDNSFAIILKRNRKEETLNAIRIAINEEFGCYCKPGVIDLERVNHNNHQVLHATAPHKGDSMELNIAISTAPLY